MLDYILGGFGFVIICGLIAIVIKYAKKEIVATRDAQIDSLKKQNATLSKQVETLSTHTTTDSVADRMRDGSF